MTVRLLGEADVPAIAAVMADDGGYAERVEGRPATTEDARGLLTDTPPGFAPDSTVALGLAEPPGRLVAVAQLVRGWPRPGYAWVSLLQVAASYAGRGHGRALHDGLLAHAATWPEVDTMRLAIAAANAQAEPFWRALRYSPTGERKPWHNAAGAEHEVTLWERPLAG